MTTKGNLKSVEFKQAALSVTPPSVVAQSTSSLPSVTNLPSVLKSPGAPRSMAATIDRNAASSSSPVTSVVSKGAPLSPRFTAEETILLRGLASGASSKEMAVQMRLPRESLYRLIGDLRRKTGATSDTALAVWVLRNMSGSAGENRRHAR